jgi:hypothetical protein
MKMLTDRHARSLRRAGAVFAIGSTASALSTLALMAMGAITKRRPFAAVNGPSRWVHGRHASYYTGADVRHTLLGHVIHHASSLLWAAVYDFDPVRRYLPNRGVRATAITAMAAFADYACVPRRLRPGFEAHLSPLSIAGVYVIFGGGLWLGDELIRCMAESSSRREPIDDASEESVEHSTSFGEMPATSESTN